MNIQKLTFHHRIANIAYHQNYLIIRILPSPDTLVMGIIRLDEGMVTHPKSPKVPFILGGFTRKIAQLENNFFLQDLIKISLL